MAAPGALGGDYSSREPTEGGQDLRTKDTWKTNDEVTKDLDTLEDNSLVAESRALSSLVAPQGGRWIIVRTGRRLHGAARHPQTRTTETPQHPNKFENTQQINNKKTSSTL